MIRFLRWLRERAIADSRLSCEYVSFADGYFSTGSDPTSCRDLRKLDQPKEHAVASGAAPWPTVSALPLGDADRKDQGHKVSARRSRP